MILATAHHYKWCQVAAAIKHPERGKIFDLSQDINKELGITNADVKLYPSDGYGNPDLLRELINREHPDLILHFTDPRFFGWLYSIEHEIRQFCPIAYLNIWDCPPDPKWNEPFYRSCDLLMAISKQTYGINKRMLPDYEPWQVKYVPHGINTKYNYPLIGTDDDKSEYNEFKKNLVGDKFNFVVLLNNRNIRRKNIPDIVLGYKKFCDELSPEQSKRCLLYLHTQAADSNGTDLVAVCNAVCPDYSVYISDRQLTTKELRYLYNVADVTINIASNEGFGLTTCESLMNGTPIIVNVTGGLQDQCGFSKNGKYLTADDYIKIGSLHNTHFADGVWNKYGSWVYPIWPASRSLKGSIPTPYIFDDTVNYEDVAPALHHFYNMTSEQRKKCGMEGRNYLLDSNVMMNEKDLGKNYIDAIDTLFEKWKPRKPFSLIPVNYKDKFKNVKLVDASIKKPKPVAVPLTLPKLKKIE